MNIFQKKISSVAVVGFFTLLLFIITFISFILRVTLELKWDGSISNQINLLLTIIFTLVIIFLAKMPEQNNLKV